MLVSIVPGQGAGGSVVVVHGRNFFSRNGLIVAHVDGRPVPTSCPAQTSCDVTIPHLSRSAGTVPVTITTSSGTSNTLFFHYG